MNKTKNKIIMVNGGFDPIHIGHIRYLKEAKSLGDYLIVLLNNDNWLKSKKGAVFMSEKERQEILSSIDCVDKVIISSHKKNTKDLSVCEDIKKIRPDIFAIGGSKSNENISEIKLCDELGIKIVFYSGKGKIKNPKDFIKEIKEQSNIAFYKEKIAEFKKRLKENHSETTGPNSWQRWIYENNWLFGIHYQTPIEKEKVGFDSIPDYLFPTWDGYIDILEIKKPTEEVIKKDSSHPGSYMWSSKSNEAIGQVVNYINEVDLNKYILRERIENKYPHLKDIITIKPRAFILIGKSDSMARKDKEALHKLNYSLHGIEVITYTDLLNRGNKIIEMYQKY